MMPGLRRLEIGAALFAELMSELARRGGGTRESGAFLLTNSAPQPADVGGAAGGWQAVTAVAYYDDLDPGCLTENITFTADGYTALAALCRRGGLQIAADIHAHPDRWVRQSQTDAAHPMVALPGHLALIVPHYARWPVQISDLGAHHYHGGGKWTFRYGSDVASVLRLAEHRPAPATIRRLVLRAIGLLRRSRPKRTPWKSRG
jgi:hypothetical protein